MAAVATKRIMLVRHGECDMNLTLACKVGTCSSRLPDDVTSLCCGHIRISAISLPTGWRPM